MTNDNVKNNFDAITKIMIAFMHYFYKLYGKDSSFQLLRFHEENIDTFTKNVFRQANKINSKMKNGCNPDRHKIIAACLKSFIASNVFSFDKNEFKRLLTSSSCNDKTLGICVLYPNEMYCIMIIKIILNEYAKFKKIDDYDLIYANHIVGLDADAAHNYVIDLFKLILGYHKQTLDFVVQELAHILFFIEMGYEVSVKDLKNNYYK